MNLTTLGPGRWRGLKNTSLPGNRFAILAFDQRGSYRSMLPAATPFNEAVRIKTQIVSRLTTHTSAVLLDYVYGPTPAMEASNGCGLLLALEKSGHGGETTARTALMENAWSVEAIKAFGAEAVKLLIYYNPSATTRSVVEELAASVIESAHAVDIPVFLEALSYSTDSETSKGTERFSKMRPDIVIETAQRLSELKPDVLKLEYPVDIAFDRDQDNWKRQCRNISEASTVPWVLLSAGVDFSDFRSQLKIASESGASGYLAGRAIWKECVTMTESDRETFLTTVAQSRIRELNDIVLENAIPWTEYYSYREFDETWYESYR